VAHPWVCRWGVVAVVAAAALPVLAGCGSKYPGSPQPDGTTGVPATTAPATTQTSGNEPAVRY